MKEYEKEIYDSNTQGCMTLFTIIVFLGLIVFIIIVFDILNKIPWL